MNKQSFANNQFSYAGFFIRLLARLFDLSLWFTILVLIVFFLDLGHKGIRDLFISGSFVIIFLFFIDFLDCLYLSLTTSFWGGSLGKLIAGLYVIDANGQKLSLFKTFFRYLVGYKAAALLFGLGFFWIIKDRQKQGWHDQLTGSYVVYQRKNRFWLLLLSLILILFFNFLLLLKITNAIADNQILQKEIQNIKSSYEEVIKNQSITPSPFVTI